MINPFLTETEKFIKTTLEMAACDMVRVSGLRQNKFPEMAAHFITAITTEMTAAKYPPEAIRAMLESVKGSIEAHLVKGELK